MRLHRHMRHGNAHLFQDLKLETIRAEECIAASFPTAEQVRTLSIVILCLIGISSHLISSHLISSHLIS